MYRNGNLYVPPDRDPQEKEDEQLEKKKTVKRTRSDSSEQKTPVEVTDDKERNEVRRVAYFLMPEARLYSKEVFKGRHCIQITPDNRDNIVEELRQSVIYRKKQLECGVVETNGVYDELQYVKDTEVNGLFPLKKDEEKNMKEENFFSQYGLFNN